MLNSARGVDAVSEVIANAKEEITRLPLPAAAKALMVLASANGQDKSQLSVMQTVNRVSGCKKILTALSTILNTAISGGDVTLPLPDLMDVCDLAASLGGPSANSDLVQTREAAPSAGADIVFRQLAAEKSKLEVSSL